MIEQRAITLAIEYNHVLHLDISDCHGSIYTHSIAWALHTKEKAKKDRRSNAIGNIIDRQIQAMSNGQTNGIPQGSTLMDFIAEIVLGYADLELSKRLEKNISLKKEDYYKILRYRDDYRIFTTSPQQSSIIAKELSEVLSDLNFKINSQKTIDNNDLVLAALKPDKIHWIYYKRKTDNIQKWLLQLCILAEKFPNSGILFMGLKDFLKWLQKRDRRKEIRNPDVLISILVNLAYKNPRLYPLVVSSISYLIDTGGNLEGSRGIKDS